jgi:hypothetical protein
VGDLLWFSCFFEIEKATGGILKSLYELPFPGVVLMESMDRYCFRFGFTTSDLKRFLEGFRLFRPHLKSYFFQFHLPDRVDSEFQDIFGLFDAKNNRWDMPLDRFLEIVNQATKTS